MAARSCSGGAADPHVAGAVLAAVGQRGAPAEMQSLRGDLATVDTVLSIVSAQDLQRQLSRLTSGEGVLESSFLGYEPVTIEPNIWRTRQAMGRDETIEWCFRITGSSDPR